MQVLNPSNSPTVLKVDASGNLLVAGSGGGGGGGATPTAMIGGNPTTTNPSALQHAVGHGITGSNYASALVANTWTQIYSEAGSGVLSHLLVGVASSSTGATGTIDFRITINGAVVGSFLGYSGGQIPPGGAVNFIGNVAAAASASPGSLPYSGGLVVEVRSTVAEPANTFAYRSKGYRT